MNCNIKTATFVWCLVLLGYIDPVVSTIRDGTTNIKLPKLFEYDDFDECRKGNPSFRYCVVQAVIQPDNNSPIWQNISSSYHFKKPTFYKLVISANRRNFPHDQLERGLCLQRCLTQLAVSHQVSVDVVESNLITEQEQNAYLDQCLNLELKISYNLHVSTTVMSCITEDDFRISLGVAEIVFIGMVVLIILLIAIATARDLRRDLKNQYDAFIQPFSVSRNIRKLLDCDKTDGNLAYLDGFRVIYTIIILVVHSSLPMIRMPLKNVEDFEAQTNSAIFPVINSLNTHMITFFFVLGGMVLSVGFLNRIDKSKGFTLLYQWKKLLNRLARLLPAYALIIFYQATVFKWTKKTPVAFKFVDYCSEHWWSNLLMINNFVHLSEPCLQYGWYLGADFQLFLIGLGTMTLIWKYPSLKKICVSAMLIVAFAVPAIVIYLEKLDATMSFDMRHALNQLREYKEFLRYYTPFYTNAGTYFFGMIAGMVYHHVSKKKLLSVADRYTKQAFPGVLGLLIVLSGFLAILPWIEVEKPSLFLSIYGSALKAVWGITHATIFLMYAFKSNSVQVAFLEHPILKVLAKLSYSIYIVQYSIIHMVYSNLSVPIRYDMFNTVLITSANILITFCCAILLHLAVEVPVATILKQVIDGKLGITNFSIKDQKLS